MTIYAPPTGVEHSGEEFTAATLIMQTFSNELSTLLSGKEKI